SSGLSARAFRSKDERIKLAEDGVADYKDKLPGQSADAARDAVRKLQETVEHLTSLAQYGLAKEAEQRMVEALKYGLGKVTISRALDASDADRLYRQVVSAFKAAGWTAEVGTILGLSGENPDS